MHRRDKQARGFSLIEAAVAIGIIAILAAAAAPMVLKALNQQREAKTRADVKTAWEAMFGASDRRVANMRADFGFTPPATNPISLQDLRFLTNRLSPPSGNAPVQYPTKIAGGAFTIGWNGPYWFGSVRGGGNQSLPVDAWGRPIQLTYNGTGYQVRSLGADGRANTLDDITYPSSATPLAQSICTPKITIMNGNLTAQYSVSAKMSYASSNGGVITVDCVLLGSSPEVKSTLLDKGGQCTFVLPVATTSLPAGFVQMSVTNISSSSTQSSVFELIPGDQRVFVFTVN